MLKTIWNNTTLQMDTIWFYRFFNIDFDAEPIWQCIVPEITDSGSNILIITNEISF